MRCELIFLKYLLHFIPNPQSPIPNPQSPIPIEKEIIGLLNIKLFNKNKIIYI